MRLYISRHAQAVSKDEHPERPLSDVGRDQAERVSAFAKAAGMEIENAFHSGKARARQTAEIYAKTLGGDIDVQAIDGLLPEDDPAGLDNFLDDLTAPALLAGHLPHLEGFIHHLTTGAADAGFLKLSPAALICLDREPGRRRWRLAWYVEPSLLP
jgi:phosphohistidine phosphatase